MTNVVIVGGGFAGLNAAKCLSKLNDVQVTLIDKENYHLFQPLLYQVATAGLNPGDIAAPIRSILRNSKNTRVLHGEVTDVDLRAKVVITSFGELPFDKLLLACGATHSYFGNDHWSDFAPGLKSIENATDIRRRILSAFEQAESSKDEETRRKLMTFVVIGGGPTGVELAGAIGEMSRFTLAKDFRSINAKSTRVFLMEAGPKILSAFPTELADHAARDLETLGVQIWTSSPVTSVDENGVQVGDEKIAAATVIWAAGVKAPSLGEKIGLPTDQAGRIVIQSDLSVEGYPDIFVAGDQANFDVNGKPLPGVAPVAAQQGKFFATTIRNDLAGKNRKKFKYLDKGIMATIGRNRAIACTGRWKLTGRLAWLAWLVVHIYFLTGFRNRLFVVMSWAWSYLTYRRGARLIVGESHQESFSTKSEQETSPV